MVEISERLDTDIDPEDVMDVGAIENGGMQQSLHFKLDEPIRVEVGDTVGLPVYVEAEYFVAIDFDGDVLQMPREMAEEYAEQNDGEMPTEHVDEGTVFVSNEDGEVGPGVTLVEDGDLDDAIEDFETTKLDLNNDAEDD